MKLRRKRSPKPVTLYAVYTGSYSDTMLHALFPTKELAERYMADFGIEQSDKWNGGYIQEETLYPREIDWAAELLKRQYEKNRPFMPVEERFPAPSRPRPATTPHQITVAQMGTERGSVGKHQDPYQRGVFEGKQLYEPRHA